MRKLLINKLKMYKVCDSQHKHISACTKHTRTQKENVKTFHSILSPNGVIIGQTLYF